MMREQSLFKLLIIDDAELPHSFFYKNEKIIYKNKNMFKNE